MRRKNKGLVLQWLGYFKRWNFYFEKNNKQSRLGTVQIPTKGLSAHHGYIIAPSCGWTEDLSPSLLFFLTGHRLRLFIQRVNVCLSVCLSLSICPPPPPPSLSLSLCLSLSFPPSLYLPLSLSLSVALASCFWPIWLAVTPRHMTDETRKCFRYTRRKHIILYSARKRLGRKRTKDSERGTTLTPVPEWRSFFVAGENSRV